MHIKQYSTCKLRSKKNIKHACDTDIFAIVLGQVWPMGVYVKYFIFRVCMVYSIYVGNLLRCSRTRAVSNGFSGLDT